MILAILLAATPGLFQFSVGGADNIALNTTYSYKVRLPNQAGAGNMLVLCLTSNSSGGATPWTTPTDDKSNTWAAGPVNDNGSENIAMFYALNVAAGTSLIQTTCNSAATCQFPTNWPGVAEFYNIATSSAKDGTGAVASATSPNVNATTTAAGDLVVMCSMENSSAIDWGSFTLGANWTPLVVNRHAGITMQYKIGGAAGSEACNFTAPSGTSNMICQPFKNATAGTSLPPGMRIKGVTHFAGNQATCTPFTCNATGIALQIPCTGNLLVLAYDTASGNLNTITDSAGDTWTHLYSDNQTGGGTNYGDFWYLAHPTCSATKTITPVYNLHIAFPDAPHMVLWDVAGAASSPFDAGNHGTTIENTYNNGQHTMPAITPTQGSGMIFWHMSVATHTINGTDIGQLDSHVSSIQDNAGGAGTQPPCWNTSASQLNADNGYAHSYYADNSTVALTFKDTDTNACATKGLGELVMQGAAFADGSSPINGTAQGISFIRRLGIGP